MSKPIPVVWRGEPYPSIRAAAKAAGVTEQVMGRAYCRGAQDRAGTGYRGPRAAIQVTWRGHRFPSLNACASYLWRHPRTVKRMAQAGTLDDLEPRA